MNEVVCLSFLKVIHWSVTTTVEDKAMQSVLLLVIMEDFPLNYHILQCHRDTTLPHLNRYMSRKQHNMYMCMHMDSDDIYSATRYLTY